MKPSFSNIPLCKYYWLEWGGWASMHDTYVLHGPVKTLFEVSMSACHWLIVWNCHLLFAEIHKFCLLCITWYIKDHSLFVNLFATHFRNQLSRQSTTQMSTKPGSSFFFWKSFFHSIPHLQQMALDSCSRLRRCFVHTFFSSYIHSKMHTLSFKPSIIHRLEVRIG